ncbi:MAG: glycosyltransferase family 2 protein, partial [Turicibacter sp.]
MIVSILTPTYNRAYTLQRLYDSICQQSTKNDGNYEWIIVDDGSIDDTKQLIKKFIDENNISIKYLYQENAGKPSAINLGVDNSTATYIFIVDSDDMLTNDAIDTIIYADMIA